MAREESQYFSHAAVASAGSDPASGPTENQVREELDRVLSSHAFRLSKRCQDFLRYVVDATLAGEADTLKERTIGVEVFGRPARYHPSDDAVVRVRALEVRKRLALYYAEEGAHNAIRIEVPPGAYVAEFRFREVLETATAGHAPKEFLDPVSEGDVGTPPAARKTALAWPRSQGLWAGGIVVLACLAAFLWVQPLQPPSALDQCWSPVLQGPSPVSLCVAFMPAYILDRNAPATPRLEDFRLREKGLVSVTDLRAMWKISDALTAMDQRFQARIGDEVSLYDLRQGPAVLVGYSHTRWKQLSKELRFYIDLLREPLGVLDNDKPTDWKISHHPAESGFGEDYAVVSRVFHPDTRNMLVGISGITGFGTEAASDLVTDPDLLADILRDTPAGWQDKNLQVVLHVKVISGVPSSPRVVATHLW
jgi:hypothetical protein